MSPRGGYGMTSSPLTEETKRKMSLKLKGGKWSEEAKQKIKGKKPWNTGIKFTENQKKNLKGRIPWNKNKKMNYSEETKKQISQSLLGKTKGRKQGEEEIRKRVLANTGKKRTKEQKNRMSESHKGQVSERKGKKLSEETKRKISLSIIENYKRKILNKKS